MVVVVVAFGFLQLAGTMFLSVSAEYGWLVDAFMAWLPEGGMTSAIVATILEVDSICYSGCCGNSWPNARKHASAI